MSQTQASGAPPKVSDLRKRITVGDGKGAKFSAVVRPYNLTEAVSFFSRTQRSEFDAYVWLFDQCAQDGREFPATVKFSIGLKLDLVSGKGTSCRLMASDDLSDEAAEKFVAIADPDAICIAYGDKEFLFRSPLPGTVDSFIRQKLKSPLDLTLNKAFLVKHRFYGDLDAIERDSPHGFVDMSDLISERGGILLEAEVGEV